MSLTGRAIMPNNELQGNVESGGEVRGKLSGLEMIHGYSAYEVAVVNGFSGTEEEWLESLKGEKGDKGDRGPGAGDMLSSVYDPQGKKTDIFKAVSDLREEWQATLLVSATVE